MREALLVGLGGCLGAITRYGVSEFVKQRVPSHPHAGTFAVNVTGCLIIGFVLSLAAAENWNISDTWKLVVVTGCLGALTTFSTFGYETISLMQDKRMGGAVLYVVGNLAVGLPAVWLGMKLANWFSA